jgi:hypothetical protein
MKISAKDVVVGQQIMWQDKITDEMHVYTVMTIGTSVGGDGLFYVFAIERPLEYLKVERRNIVCAELELVTLPGDDESVVVGTDPLPAESENKPGSTTGNTAELS